MAQETAHTSREMRLNDKLIKVYRSLALVSTEGAQETREQMLSEILEEEIQLVLGTLPITGASQMTPVVHFLWSSESQPLENES